jgi:hypothetical protein
MDFLAAGWGKSAAVTASRYGKTALISYFKVIADAAFAQKNAVIFKLAGYLGGAKGV